MTSVVITPIEQVIEVTGSENTINIYPNLAPITQGFVFATRAEFVTSIDAFDDMTDGKIVVADGLLYKKLAASSAIADLPGFVPNGDYTPMHWGCVGDGVTDDGANFNLALAAWKTAVAGVKDMGGPSFNGLGKNYKSTVSLNCTGRTEWRWDMRDFTIYSHATGKVAFDMVGTRGITMTNVHIYGDETNRPRVGIFRARALAGGAKGFSDTYDWRSVRTGGWFTLAGAVLYGAESDAQVSCRYWNSDEDGQAAIIGGYDFYPVVSEYEAPMSGATSHINVSYMMCEFRQTPFTRAGLITAVSLTNPMTITLNSAAPFVIGDEVVIGEQDGCDEIFNMKATITNKVGNVLTFGAVDASGFGAWTSGGYVFAYFSRPALTVGRANGHNFNGSYIVSYGTCHIEIPYADGISNRNLSFTNTCMEGTGNTSSIRFLPGTNNLFLQGFVFDGYQARIKDAFISSNASGAGKVQIQNSRIAMNSAITSHQFFDDASKFQCYNVDIVAPDASLIDGSAILAFTGSIHTISDGAYKKYTPTLIGNVQFEPKAGTSQKLFFEDGAGNNSAFISYDSNVDVFSFSLDGTTADYNFVAAAFYPNVDVSYNLGLTSRYWNNGYIKTLSTEQVLFPAGRAIGGTVTQITSKATAVTLNKRRGQIITDAAALAAVTSVAFRVNNSLITAADTVVVHAQLPTGKYRVEVTGLDAGFVDLRLTNLTGGSLSEAVTINFALHSGTTT